MNVNSEPAAQYKPDEARNEALRVYENDVLDQARKILNSRVKAHPIMDSPTAVKMWLELQIAHLPYEVFVCLFLDNRHGLVAHEELFRGTIDGTNVPPREVLRACITHNAAAVVFAHNHPSGNAEPSQADRTLTNHLKYVLKLIEVRVLDHFVVGDNTVISLAERGWL